MKIAIGMTFAGFPHKEIARIMLGTARQSRCPITCGEVSCAIVSQAYVAWNAETTVFSETEEAAIAAIVRLLEDGATR